MVKLVTSLCYNQKESYEKELDGVAPLVADHLPLGKMNPFKI